MSEPNTTRSDHTGYAIEAMRVFLMLLFTLTLVVPVEAQHNIGRTRTELVSRQEDYREISDAFEKTKDENGALCYRIFESLKRCFYFVGDTCRAEMRVLSGKDQREIYEAAREMKAKWGEPVSYSADATEVKSLRDAMALADPMIVVAFPVNEDGIGPIWYYNTNPQEPDLTGGRFIHSEVYVDMSYIDRLPQTNHWD